MAAPSDQELTEALEAVWGDSRKPVVLRPGDESYNPWRQVEPAMAYMRYIARESDDASDVVAAAYHSMRG